jgi:FtsP/CotA-like multicopper oxidase with cupredoxin domain
MMMGMGGPQQGTEMDLLEFVVQDSSSEPGPPVPSRFSSVPDRGEVNSGTPRQTFTFGSSMMMGGGQPNHTINGLKFDMERVDIRIRRMQTEVWTFVNDSEVPHPVHAHAGQFRVLSRTGGRARVMPWEAGLKDTVLTLPGETVDVAVRFFYEGLYLLHCHNLEHEDMDMMLNFEVIA